MVVNQNVLGNLAQGAGQWIQGESNGDPDGMSQRFETDPLSVMIHRHPMLFKVIFDKMEKHQEKQLARYMVASGRSAQMKAQLEMLKEAHPETDTELGKLISAAVAGQEWEEDQGRVFTTRDMETGEERPRTIADDMDLTTEHFFTLLLEGLHGVHQHNHQVYIDSGHHHELPNERDPHLPSYLTPMGVSQPQYTPQGQYAGNYNYTPGYFYGQPGMPQQPHAELEDHHHPSMGMSLGMMALGALAA